MITLSLDKELLVPWLCKRVGLAPYLEGREALGLVDEERILGAVAFDNFTTRSAVMHVALANKHVPLRKLIAATFHYAFVQLQLERVFGYVNSTNRAALTFDTKLGFAPIAVLPRVYDDAGDCFVMMMERSMCRWIAQKHRKAA